MAGLNELSATEASARIAAGKLTSEALVAACIERIRSREKEVQAWAHFDPEAALGQARARDKAHPQSRLHGIPVGVKDVIDTHDMPTEYGSPIYRGHRPACDAACVAQVREAGGVILGKAVSTEFATRHPNKTRNPHNPEHTPGGSSQGSAAAVADRMVPIAFGTQTSSSIIRPAAYCGVVGYKPSFGLVNRAGLKFLSDSLDTIGVLTRTVPDAAMIVSAGASRMRSGSPSVQPSRNAGAEGIPFASPGGAPASAHCARAAMSSFDRRRSSRKRPSFAGFQGGIVPARVARTMFFDQRRAFSCVERVNGATWPARWQVTQLSFRICAIRFA